MKNIHVLPTDKPSRLAYYLDKLQLGAQNWDFEINEVQPVNIYITSDKEIKEWYIYEDRLLRGSVNHSKYEILYGKPVILTTDQGLIKDGVQAIDDEFLEWFVKNPNCEFVEVEKILGCVDLDAVCDFGDKTCPNSPNCLKNKYKIIIPKEEPKQETLEEALQKEYPHALYENDWNTLQNKRKEDFIKGAKWQQERSYSEKEILEINNWYLENFLDDSLGLNGKNAEQKVKHLSGKGLTKEVLNYWFEQFKKK